MCNLHSVRQKYFYYIPKSHFDFALVIGHADNSIVHDPDAGTMEDFIAISEGKRRSWFQVRITRNSFEAWVRTFEAGDRLEQQRDGSSTPTRRGRPPKTTQDSEVRLLVDGQVAKLMEYYGEFDEVDPHWKAKFHLDRKIEQYVKEELKVKASDASVARWTASSLKRRRSNGWPKP